MGDPFAGYARDPTAVADNPTPSSVQQAIANAAAKWNVPASWLTKVWTVEAGGQANAAQEVGINSSGHGGFFGLPSSSLGTAQEQADTTASLLRQYFDKFGSWGAAVNYFNTGDPATGYGTGEPKDTPPFLTGPAPSLPSIGTGPFNIKPGFGMFILAYPILWGSLYAMTYIGPGASRLAAVLAAGIAGAVVLSKGPEVKANLGL